MEKHDTQTPGFALYSYGNVLVSVWESIGSLPALEEMDRVEERFVAEKKMIATIAVVRLATKGLPKDAQAKAADRAKAEMGKITEGLGLPAEFKLPI